MGLPVSIPRAQVRGQAEHETTGRGGDGGGPKSRRTRGEGTLHPAGYCQGPLCPDDPVFQGKPKKILILMKTVGQTEPAGGPAIHRAPSQAHSHRSACSHAPSHTFTTAACTEEIPGAHIGSWQRIQAQMQLHPQTSQPKVY